MSEVLSKPAVAHAATAEISRRLCEQAARLRYEDLPADVVRTVRLFLLDTLGVIGGAAHAPGIAELNGRLSTWEQGGRASGLIGRLSYAPPAAALANGAAAHALDFDDMHDPARVHAYCVMLPALLATAEEIGQVRGRDFVLALTLAVELHARLGLACPGCLGRGWHPTMTLGVLAGTIGAGWLLGLGEDRLLHALGLAHHFAAGSAQSMLDGALSKRLGAGFAARSAVMAAFFAADGLTGPHRPLEGEAGLFRLQERGEVEPERLLAGFGERWEILNFGFKAYPCCRCKHTSIGLALGLRERGLRADDVDRVEISLPQVNYQTVGQDYDPGRDSIVHAQFNVAYGFARALVDGRVTLETYQRPQITDPGIAALTRRIRVLRDDAADPTAMGPAHIKVLRRDGGVIEVRGSRVKGSPDDPMSEPEILAKFRSCLAFGLGAGSGEADAYAKIVLGIERAPDVSILATAFPQARRP
jgi:2-methylcitrate dehydratase PrpD